MAFPTFEYDFNAPTEAVHIGHKNRPSQQCHVCFGVVGFLAPVPGRFFQLPVQVNLFPGLGVINTGAVTETAYKKCPHPSDQPKDRKSPIAHVPDDQVPEVEAVQNMRRKFLVIVPVRLDFQMGRCPALQIHPAPDSGSGSPSVLGMGSGKDRCKIGGQQFHTNAVL